MRQFRVTKSKINLTRPKFYPITLKKEALLQDELAVSASLKTHTNTLPKSHVTRCNLIDAFQKLLEAWKAPTETPCTFLKHKDFEAWEKRASLEQEPILFWLIENLVSEKDQKFGLLKKFLEEDLASQSRNSYPFPRWRKLWRRILNCQDWDTAKDLICHDHCDESLDSIVASKIFTSAALVVVAELYLRKFQYEIEQAKKLEQLPTHCNDSKNLGFGHLGRSLKSKYVMILKNFNNTNWTVSPSFYQYALETLTVMEDTSNTRSPSSPSVFTSYFDQTAPLKSPYLLLYDFPPSTSTALEILISNWKFNKGIHDFAYSLLAYDGHTLSIFRQIFSSCPPPFALSHNLFSLLATYHSELDYLSLTVALLKYFITLVTPENFLPWSMIWLRSLILSPNWEDFMSQLNNDEASMRLEHIMGTAGHKLVEDALILIVSERLLLKLRRSRNSSSNMRKKVKEGYMAILRVLQSRGLKIDLCWQSYLFSLW